MRKPKLLKAFISIFCFLPLSLWARPDQVLQTKSQFSGHNIYGPTIVWNRDQNKCQMWYMGHHHSNQVKGGDRIFYREKYGNCDFSGTSYREVYNSSKMSRQIGQSSNQWEHTGDPSVKMVKNNIDGTSFYTMFYTACRRPCNASDGVPQASKNQIWSVISGDGINWHSPVQVKINGDPTNMAQPSLVRASELPANNRVRGQYWALFFESRRPSEYRKIWHVPLDGNRRAIGNKRSVLTVNHGIVAGPEVKKIGSMWHLWYHTFDDCSFGGACAINIHKTTATNPFQFGNVRHQQTGHITNPKAGGGICATETPGVHVLSSSEYLLFFGSGNKRTRRGQCDNTKHDSIHRWRYRTFARKPAPPRVSSRGALRLSFSSNGPIRGMFCTRMLELADPHTWHDNYICANKNMVCAGVVPAEFAECAVHAFMRPLTDKEHGTTTTYVFQEIVGYDYSGLHPEGHVAKDVSESVKALNLAIRHGMTTIFVTKPYIKRK